MQQPREASGWFSQSSPHVPNTCTSHDVHKPETPKPKPGDLNSGTETYKSEVPKSALSPRFVKETRLAKFITVLHYRQVLQVGSKSQPYGCVQEGKASGFTVQDCEALRFGCSSGLSMVYCGI